MQWFVVKYRKPDGTMTEAEFEAADRPSLFKLLEQKKITAIRIVPGRLGRRPHKPPSPRGGKSPAIGKGIVAGAIVIAAAVGAFWFLNKKHLDEPIPKTNKKSTKIAERLPVSPVKLVVSEQGQEDNESKPKPLRGNDFSRMTEDKKLAVIEQRLAETPIPDESTNRTFRTGLEQVMGWVFTTEVGDAPPPLPNISDFDLVHINEILDMKNPVRDTDNDKTADSKATVDFVKKELKKYLEKGGDPQEFLAFYHSELKQAYQERQMVQQQAMQILKDEPELVFDFLDTANKRLAEKGIKAAIIPQRVLMRYGITNEQ